MPAPSTRPADRLLHVAMQITNAAIALTPDATAQERASVDVDAILTEAVDELQSVRRARKAEQIREPSRHDAAPREAGGSEAKVGVTGAPARPDFSPSLCGVGWDDLAEE